MIIISNVEIEILIFRSSETTAAASFDTKEEPSLERVTVEPISEEGVMITNGSVPIESLGSGDKPDNHMTVKYVLPKAASTLSEGNNESDALLPKNNE